MVITGEKKAGLWDWAARAGVGNILDYSEQGQYPLCGMGFGMRINTYTCPGLSSALSSWCAYSLEQAINWKNHIHGVVSSFPGSTG